MSDTPTIKIDLKQPMYSVTGKELKQSIRLRSISQCISMNDKEFMEFQESKTVEELLKLTPTDNLGESIKGIMVNCIKPANNEKAAELFQYVSKINNCMLTSKGEWTVNKDELKRFQEFLRTAKENISVMVNGQVDTIIEKYYAELVTKSS